jgi:hypothetical protein
MSNPFGSPPFPLMNEDGDWFAFPKTFTKREVVSEMIHNYADWWLDEHDAVYYDDDDTLHGWVTAIRDMFGRVGASNLRPADPGEYGESDDYWYETGAGSVEAWVVKL